MKSTSFILFLFLIGSRALAFDILRVNPITDRDGLSQNTVRCMMQDRRGFMWMGTINGLNRYDGRKFITVQPHPGFPMAFQDNRISSINEDRNGYIWVNTFSDMLLCYDPRLEVFVDYAPENKTKIFSNIKITSNGDIWLWGAQGICRVRHENGELHSWTPNAQTFSQQPITFVFEDTEGKIWFSGDNELFRLTDNTVTTMSEGTKYSNAHQQGNQLFFVSAEHINAFDMQKQTFLSPVSIPNTYPVSYLNSCLLNDGFIFIATKHIIYAFDTHTMHISPAERFFDGKKLQNANFLPDNKGNLWLYNGSGVLWMHCEDNSFEPLRLISSDVLSISQRERYQIYHDSRGIIWVSTFGNGLFALDQNGKQIFHFTAGKDLATNYLLSVTEDTSGEIWVGTELAGAAKISLTNYPFEIFYPNPNGDSDRDNAVRLIYEDANKYYWFGTRDGYLHVCDSLLQPIYKHQIAGGIPFTIAEDPQGNKWVGTKGGGLLVFDADGKHKLQTYRLTDREKQSSSSNNIFTIMNDNKGRMWITSFGGGLHLVEKHAANDVTFRQISMKNSQRNMMRGMIQDYDGMIWVGTNDGLIIFDPDAIITNEENYITLSPNTQNGQSPNSNEVRVVFEDSRKRIWIGTTGGGLNLLVREKSIADSRFKHYGAENGLSNEMIQAIQEDDNGHIWVSTESGISKLDFQTERFENFSFSSSRHAAIFNELSCQKKVNGELMFGSYNGVYIFDPAKIVYDTYSPPVVMTGLRINGIVMDAGESGSPLTESIMSTKKILLAHNQNSFNLEYTMLNFHAPEYNQYIYYLEGYETDWNSVSRNNVATYRNLPPGSYYFKVKGCNSFGKWSNVETGLQIVISPPWWKSGWAMVLYLILVSVIIFFASRLMLKIHRLNTAVEVEKQLTEYKLRFFTNISHEFRTPLTIIRGSIENLSAQQDLPSTMSKQINTLAKSSARLLRLIDQLLEFRRLQNDKMELKLEQTEACEFFRDIYSTFREMAEKKQIEYVFESDITQYTLLLDKSKMDKIAYNLLSNAFKNTPIGGRIAMKLIFSPASDTFALSISDNGTGVPREQRDMLFVRFKQINYASDGTGVGLHLTAELAKVHKGNIAYSDSDMGGACFTVSVPLSDENYDKADIINISQPTERFVTTIETESDAAEGILAVPIEKDFEEYKVMVIEDDDDVRNFLESQLNQYFTVTTASNGLEGLEKVLIEQPDIVVCDVMMPEMDGYEFTKRLKENFETSHIPVIILTAYSSEEHRLKGIQSGADAYITKPFSINYLLARIVKLIEQREKLQQKFATEPGMVRLATGFTDRDKVFLDQLHDIIEKNMADPEFKLESFLRTIGMSRTAFFKKLKGVSGYSPQEYVRIMRMKKAAELLVTTDRNISEVSFQVGINDPYYFSRCFKAQFSKSPSQYRKGE